MLIEMNIHNVKEVKEKIRVLGEEKFLLKTITVVTAEGEEIKLHCFMEDQFED